MEPPGATMGSTSLLGDSSSLDVTVYVILPEGESGSEAGRSKYFIFDGVFVGAVLAPAAKLMATPLDQILWSTPLCTVGHAIAQQDASLGVKGIERPPDLKALDRMMAEAEAREKSGQLHDWQYIDPISYPLTETQAKANPSLMPLFDQIRDAFLKSGGRPVNPELFPVTPAEETHV